MISEASDCANGVTLLVPKFSINEQQARMGQMISLVCRCFSSADASLSTVMWGVGEMAGAPVQLVLGKQ